MSCLWTVMNPGFVEKVNRRHTVQRAVEDLEFSGNFDDGMTAEC